MRQWPGHGGPASLSDRALHTSFDATAHPSWFLGVGWNPHELSSGLRKALGTDIPAWLSKGPSGSRMPGVSNLRDPHGCRI